MNVKPYLLTFLLATSVVTQISCQNKYKKMSEKVVQIETSEGKIVVKLYNETPLHRDNFLKQVENKTYDGVIFHRVIKDFMIQTGDPNSKNPAAGKQYGGSGNETTIAAEFNPALIHKKGALAAARTGDEMNPERRSSPTQFYIVQGKVPAEDELAQIEEYISQAPLQGIFNNLIQKELQKNAAAGIQVSQDTLIENAKQETLRQFAAMPKFAYSPEQRQVYKTLGGTPFLDQQYTVFGEVIEGLEVVDKIAATPTQPGDRPTADIFVNSIKVLN